MPKGGVFDTVEPLPVEALRLDAATAEALRRMGLRRVRALLRLPRAAVTARFGPEVARRLEQALGETREPITPRQPPPRHQVRLAFAEALLRPEDLTAGTEELLGRLCAGLNRAGQGARRLTLRLYRVDGGTDSATVGTSRARRDAQALMRLFTEPLTQLCMEPGVEAMSLTAPWVEALDANQMVLARPAPVCEVTAGAAGSADAAPAKEERTDEGPTDGDRAAAARRAGGAGDVAELVDRLAARLGSRNLLRLERRESHFPERAVAVRSLADAARRPRKGNRLRETVPDAAHAPAARDLDLPPSRLSGRQPVLLLPRPEPVQAVALLPDAPPTLMRRGRERGPGEEGGPGLGRALRLRALSGPERVSPEWWLCGPGDHPRPRDYYRVEDDNGSRWWVFREGLHDDDTPPRWYVHGVFA